MKKKTIYTDEPMGKPTVVPDFLPPPEELARRMKNTKVTIALSAESIAYFKLEAEKYGVQYQKLIRQVLDDYVSHQRQSK